MPAGRPKGSKNRDTHRAAGLIKRTFGEEFDPLVKALMLAGRLEEEGDIKEATTAYLQAAKFLHPALRAQEIEHSGNLRVVEVDMTGYKDDEPEAGS